jgi:phage baseplate assembly protein gpV
MSLEELFAGVETAIDALNRKFYGVCVGEVRDIQDPMSLGRVKLRFPFLDESDESPWARVAQPMAGQTHGFYFIPSVGDEVLVCFEHGDVTAPYVLGSLWNAQATPPLQSPSTEIRAIRTPGGAQLVLEDRPSTITLQTSPTNATSLPTSPSANGPHHSLQLGNDGIRLATPKAVKLEVGTTTLEVTPSGVKLSCGGATVELTTSSITLQAPTIKISGSGMVEVQGGVLKLN